MVRTSLRSIRSDDERRKNNTKLLEKQKEQPSSEVNRFFKIMFGKDHSEVMYLPPKFARTVRLLVGQKIPIENLNGQKWHVTISPFDRLLAFKEGWPTFFRENNLQQGDMLVFSYISGSHFSVDIFERKTACLRKDFTKGRTQTNKRFKKNPEIVPIQTTDINHTVDELGSSSALASGSKLQNSQSNLMTPIASVINLEEDPNCIVNRDVDYGQGEDMNILFDLLSFDLKKHKSDGHNLEKTLRPLIHVVEQKETNGDGTQTPANHLNKVAEDFNGLFTDKCHSKPSDDGNSRKVMPDDVSNSRTGCNNFLPSDTVSPSIGSTQVVKRDHAFMPKPFDSSLGSSLPTNPDAKGFLPSDTMSPSLGSTQAAKRENEFMPKLFDSSLRSSFPVTNSVKQAVHIKKELMETANKPIGFAQVSLDAGKFPHMAMNFCQTSSPIVKVEPNDIVPLVAASSFPVKVKSQSYLFLFFLVQYK